MRIRSIFWCLIAITVTFGVTPVSSNPNNLEGLLKSVVSLGAKVTGEVPVANIQRGLEKIDQGVDVSRVTDPTMIRQALNALDVQLLKQFDALAKSDADKLIRLHGGATQLMKASPDALARSRAIQQGGSELLIAAERYGEEMTRPVFRILAAEDIGQLPPGSLQRFSHRVAIRGKQILNVWNTKILPNWKQFAAAGLLTDILLNDGDWITATGEFIAKKGAETIVDTTIVVPKVFTEVIQEKIRGPDKIWVFGIIAVLVLLVGAWLYRGLSRFASIFAKFLKFALRGFGVIFGSNKPALPNAKKRNRMKADASHKTSNKL